MADNEVFLPVEAFDISLYTREKDPKSEAKMEAALGGIVWEKAETYVDSERCYIVIYSIEL